MPRSIWSGAISFGLVNVPVKLYSAVSRKTVRFHQLHDKDHVRIQQKRVCPEDGEEVPYDNVVKGYEIAPGHHVVVTPEELEGIDPKKTRTIDIEDFVELDQIDPIYYDSAYYLVPDKGADKAYNLLLRAMRDSGRVAVARVVIRSKEHLTAIRPTGDVMTMATMLFSDEVVSPEGLDELPEDDQKAGKRELEMARQLIESLSTDFEPGKYRDEYRERVLELVERKAEGEEIAVQPAEEPERVPDLMAALEASVKAARDDSGDGAGKPAGSKSRSGGRSRSSSGSSNGHSGSSSSRTKKSKSGSEGSKPRSAGSKPGGGGSKSRSSKAGSGRAKSGSKAAKSSS
ncbi:MAG TPA: Ku protein [Thermoleophilaceae bacterium]|nr:Ku protein [Thermoleophilaceae bacterium]